MKREQISGAKQRGSLAGIGALVLGVSGFTTSTTEVATTLFWASLAGVVVVGLVESRVRKRWTLR